MKRSWANQRNKNIGWKKGLGEYFHFERSKRKFKSRPLDFDQLVKLFKKSSFTHQEKHSESIYTKKEMKWKLRTGLIKSILRSIIFIERNLKMKLVSKRRKVWYFWCCIKSEALYFNGKFSIFRTLNRM